MAEKLEDLHFPAATVLKIIKEALPDGVNIGKDVRAAVSRAASVFVLYITSEATKEAHKSSRKTLSGQDIIAALKELEFGDFVGLLEVFLKEIKDAKSMKKEQKSKTINSEEHEEIEILEENDCE